MKYLNKVYILNIFLNDCVTQDLKITLIAILCYLSQVAVGM